MAAQACAGNFVAGASLVPTCLVPKAPFKDWLAGVGVQAEWPCWGKMRTIHCDNAKEFRGTVIGRACQDHDIAVEHRPPREPRYGGHIERRVLLRKRSFSQHKRQRFPLWTIQ